MNIKALYEFGLNEFGLNEFGLNEFELFQELVMKIGFFELF